MTGSTEGMDGMGSADARSAANVKAQGAADRMWRKVEEDLDQIDRAKSDDGEDD